jgi:DNA gyrase subunit B
MYIGSVSTKGLNHLIYEIVDNSVDEHLAGYCDTIKVTLEADGSATVEDNGRGIPVGMHEKGISAERLVFTTLHAGGKFDNSAYKTSGGLHGVGSSVVNALSTRLTVRVKSGGCIYEDHYERGIPVMDLVDGLLPVVGKTRETGTTINFLPDDTIFDKTRFKEDEVKSRLHETAVTVCYNCYFCHLVSKPSLCIILQKLPDSQFETLNLKVILLSDGPKVNHICRAMFLKILPQRQRVFAAQFRI